MRFYFPSDEIIINWCLPINKFVMKTSDNKKMDSASYISGIG